MPTPFPTATITQGSGLTVNTLPPAGQQAMDSSLPVVIANNQSAVPVTIAATLSVSQSGVWTVQIGNTPNTTAIKVDGSAVTQPVSGTFWQATQPVSAVSWPLPTGAMGSTGGTVGLVGGTAAIGSIIGRTSAPLVTPTITAGAYTANQEVGGLMTFAVGGAGSGILESIRVTCKSVQTTAVKLYIFDTNPTNSSWTDKSTPAINAADVSSLRDVFLLSSPDSGLGTHTIWSLDGIACSFIGASIYGILVVTGTPTFSSTSDITVKLGIVDD